jgi:hypothetical protein
LYHVALQRERIECAEVSDSAKQLILRDNAVSLFDLQDLPASGRFD